LNNGHWLQKVSSEVKLTQYYKDAAIQWLCQGFEISEEGSIQRSTISKLLGKSYYETGKIATDEMEKSQHFQNSIFYLR
tara:strand:- start:354 stop:590 length:237 start_codon:yes stop_codon:yes gene_type:complete